MSDPTRWIAYDYAVLRVLPHVHLDEFVNVGVVLHARTEEYLGIRVLTDPEALRERVPDLEVSRLVRYLNACRSICEAAPDGGPVALAPPSERFHWITSPRSDPIQCSPVRGGLCRDPERTLDELFAKYVPAAPRGP